MAVDGSTRDGVFKQVFGDFVDAVPDWAILSNDIKFQERARVGKNYIFPVRVRRTHGITLESGATSLTAFALNDVKTGQTDQAEIDGSILLGRESFAYKAVAAAMDSGKHAFVDVFADGVEDLFNTSGYYLEAFLRYGQTSWGAFAEAGPNATTATLDVSAASCAPGLLAQLEGAYIDVYSDTTFGTKRNSNDPIEVTGFDWDPDTGVGALSLAGTAADIDAIAVGDIFVPRGAYSSGHKTFAGLDAIMSNTGTLFGISAATYPVWAGTTYDCGTAQATFAKLIKACVSIGTRCKPMKETLKAYVSPMTWTDLNNNIAALRRFADSTKGSADLGTGRITYYSNVGSSIEIVSDPLMKGGEGYVGFPSVAVRGGVSEPTFDLGKQTGQNDRFLLELASNAGFEIRCMWDQFLILKQPKAFVKLTGIVNAV
jgi:hypothetical protein